MVWSAIFYLGECGDALRARKLVLIVGLIAAAICVDVTGLVFGSRLGRRIDGRSDFFAYLTGATYWAIIQETVEDQHLGATSGFVHLIANCAGIIGPAVTGFIVQSSLCDVVFVADTADLADPHVAVALVAGDGGAITWPHHTSLLKAKQYLLTGDRVSPTRRWPLGSPTSSRRLPMWSTRRLRSRSVSRRSRLRRSRTPSCS